MKNSNNVKYKNDLSEKEKYSIQKIVSANYNFEILNIFKARSAYKVETPNGNVCLKKMRHGVNKAKNGKLLVEQLAKNNFVNTAKYIKTKNGQLLVKDKKFIFYATEWIDGIECDMNKIEEAIKCIEFLAKFHIATKAMDTNKLKIKNNLKNWPKIFKEGINDLENFKRFINKKRINSKFDLDYEKYIDNFINMGMLSLKYLNNSDYYKLSKLFNDSKTICHDSFYYQNIIKKNDELFIIDLDSIIIDLQINDVGKLIRRLMYKKAYSWDFKKAVLLIEAYKNINNLSIKELEVMLALIIYPHKFWKLGKKRYLKQKKWSEIKYMHKLEKLIYYDKKQQTFIEEYLQYFNSFN